MKKSIIYILIVITTITYVDAQRKVTPVETKTGGIKTIEDKKVAQKLLEKDIRPSLIFGDSIINVEKELKKDSIATQKMTYPLLHNISIGVNIFDPIMRLFGQSYGGVDFSGELSLFNRIIPAVELGFGMANSTPDDMNFTYKTPLAFYGKIGASYNFLYNKTPDFQFLAGFRLGFSAFKYDITNITINSGYWNEHVNVDILNQSSHALWGELLLGLKVKIVKAISMGWSFRYRIMFSYKKNVNSEPWYIPGIGSRNNNIGATYSIYYTLPLHKENKISDKAKEITNKLNAAQTDSVMLNSTPSPLSKNKR